MIAELTIANVGSFQGDPVTLRNLAPVNFIYGANGAGKSTIGRAVAAQASEPDQQFSGCAARWRDQRPLPTFLYNREFVERNFKDSSKVKGVFTLGEDTAETLTRIQSVRDEMESKRRTKELLRDRLLRESAQNKAPLRALDELERDASVVYQKGLQAETALPLMDASRLIELAASSILSKKIVGREDVATAALLEGFGFLGFKIEVSEDAKDYRLVRLDGSAVQNTLSEGEKTFVTFLYFWHLVAGSNDTSGVSADRVVVFDDPVSSLDSDILFIVSTLVRRTCEKAQGGHSNIKQVFVLTHNAYFHKEVTFRAHEKQVAFWLVFKSNERSSITREQRNPVRTSYQLLWDEVRNAGASPNVSLRNTLRRILENYFSLLGGGKTGRAPREVHGTTAIRRPFSHQLAPRRLAFRLRRGALLRQPSLHTDLPGCVPGGIRGDEASRSLQHDDGTDRGRDRMTTPNEAPALLLYKTEDGQTRIQCRLEEETLWLSQAQMAELFQKDVRTINEHLQNVYEEGEQSPEATIRDFRIVRSEGNRSVSRDVKHYRLEAILAVGFRVRSHRGTQFRQWATERLREFLVKGFAMDDERLKNPSGPGDDRYFDELLARIRDIRSSEKVFYRKVLDIYATSIDYDPSVQASQLFFQTVQNKMYWAAHWHTAAELISERADASRPNMGLMSWSGLAPRKADVTVAKNYLEAGELELLNRIVTAYLEFAELQALRRKPMYMADWIAKLDDFLRLGDHEILDHAGKISTEVAANKAHGEYAHFRQGAAALPAPVDRHFAEAISEAKQLEAAKKAATRQKGKKP